MIERLIYRALMPLKFNTGIIYAQLDGISNSKFVVPGTETTGVGVLEVVRRRHARTTYYSSKKEETRPNRAFSLQKRGEGHSSMIKGMFIWHQATGSRKTAWS